MPATLKLPIVIYGAYHADEIVLAFGYLVLGQNGKAFCFPSEESAEKDAAYFVPFEIDRQLLQEQVGIAADRTLYLYPVVRGAPKGQNTLPPIEGRFQAR